MFLIYYDSYVNTTKPTTSSLTFEMEPDNKASAKGDEENLEITEWHKFYLQQKHTHGIRLENQLKNSAIISSYLRHLNNYFFCWQKLAAITPVPPQSMSISLRRPPPPQKKKVR